MASGVMKEKRQRKIMAKISGMAAAKNNGMACSVAKIMASANIISNNGEMKNMKIIISAKESSVAWRNMAASMAAKAKQ